MKTAIATYGLKDVTVLESYMSSGNSLVEYRADRGTTFEVPTSSLTNVRYYDAA